MGDVLVKQPKKADEWKRRLDVWALAAYRAIERLSDDELAQLKADCDQATPTNCWWAAYKAAQGLLPFVHSEMEARRRAPEDNNK